MNTLIQLVQDDFEYIGPIGIGTFGTVVRARWKTKDKEVAIKRLPTLNPENREIQVLTSLRHKNIIQFFGLVRDNNGHGIVTELAENGSLYDFLRQKNKNNETLDYERVILWALDIARGMEYLHFQAPQTVIHRDLKSKNVVINSKFVCKLCDFGSSKFQQNTLREASTIAGTMAWMAPEVIKESLVIEASDTYSFSIVFWELLTCKVPYDTLENLQVAWLVAMKGERPHLPAEVPHKFKTLIQSCWKEDYKQRPNFQFLVKNLDNLSLDRDLQQKTAVFLDNPDKWRGDIGDKNDKLMKQSNELTDKEKQLEIWERQLTIKEKKLFLKEQRHHSRSSYESLDKWTPRRVYEWVRELRRGHGDEAEDQFMELANRFYAESIDGRALMLLGEEELIKMKITGLGVRIDLLDSIKELRVSNQNMMNFPPLAATLQEFTPQTMQNQSLKTVELILIFGSICRPNPDIPKETKWKLYMELDGDESAIPTVERVKFVLSDKSWNISLSRPPFIMNNWIVSEKLGMAECKVSFDDLIVVTPVEINHLFTPDRGDDTTELKVSLRIKTTSMTRMTPQNSLSGSDISAPPIVTSQSQFEYSPSDITRTPSSCTNTSEYKGLELTGSWANQSPGSLARMISSQNSPKRIVRGGPVPSYSSSNLHPNPNPRSQSSMSHVSPRLSHGSSSLASSPSNSANISFSSTGRTSRTSGPPSRYSYSPTQPYRGPSPYHHDNSASKRLSLPDRRNKPNPGFSQYDPYPSDTSSRVDSIEERAPYEGINGEDTHNGTGVGSRSDLKGPREGREGRNHRPDELHQKNNSDAGSTDERVYRREERHRAPKQQGNRDCDRRERRTERRDNYTRKNNRREDTREYRRDDKKGQYTRRDDRLGNRRDREPRREDKRWDRREEGRGDRWREGGTHESTHKRRDSLTQQFAVSSTNEVKQKNPTGTGEESDSEWTVVAKNKSKLKSGYY